MSRLTNGDSKPLRFRIRLETRADYSFFVTVTPIQSHWIASSSVGIATQPKGLLRLLEHDGDRTAAGRAKATVYRMMFSGIGLLVGGLVIGTVVGWACGRATMTAKYDKLKRAYEAYVAYKNNLGQRKRS